MPDHTHSVTAHAREDGLLKREELLRAVWRQRAYADRTDTPFVFVRMGLSGTQRANETAVWMERLGVLVGGACRGSDTAGWCDGRGGRVGMLLPGAAAQGALRVVGEVEAALREQAGDRDGAPELVCELFVYPGSAYAPAVDWAVGGLDAEQV